MRNTLEQFNEMVDGTLDKKIKLLCVYSIKYHLRRFVKFDTAEQKWYSENYPNDPVLIVDKDKEQKSGSERSSTKIEKKKTIHVQRVYNKEIFAEAVLIAGVPKFLLATNGPDEISISTVDFIPLGKEDKIASPLPAESYINKPYTFNSQLELDATIEEAKKLTLDHLYGMVKRIWKKYIDADDFHISICAADTIFTYFQDKAGMTHYLFFVGGPGSGKSNNLEVFHFLAYRNLTSTGITSATLYRFYGGREEGIGTICEDEANDLDKNELKMQFYKNGYTTGRPVIRNDDTESGRTPQKFFTFGWKALAAERLPDSVIARGFMDRTIPMSCTYGFPDYDITEVTNPMGEEKFIQLLQELEKTRNLLLVYRILHHGDKFADIPLNITGREKQLFKPILRIFNNTEIQKELEKVISNYINERSAANADTQHAFIFRTVVGLINEKGTHELASKDIWDKIREVPGEFMYRGNTKYETVDYGVLTQKLVIKICKEVLGAKKGRDNSQRKWIFNKNKLNRLNQLFNLSLEVKVTRQADVTHSGIGRYVLRSEGNQEKDNTATKNNDYPNKSTDNRQNITVSTDANTQKHSTNALDVPDVSQASPIIKCDSCGIELEPFYMKIHMKIHKCD